MRWPNSAAEIRNIEAVKALVQRMGAVKVQELARVLG
jgi:hypothetical protein